MRQTDTPPVVSIENNMSDAARVYKSYCADGPSTDKRRIKLLVDSSVRFGDDGYSSQSRLPPCSFQSEKQIVIIHINNGAFCVCVCSFLR